MTPPCPVIVFAKAPLPGYAKTRLIPALGAEGAAQLAERLLQAAVEAALAAGIGPVELCCAPDARHPAFQHLARRGDVVLTVQGEGDLGARMHRALVRTLASHSRALLIGTDAPGLDARFLRNAAHTLADHDAVFGPAVDGGYTLVGLREPQSSLFTHMAWSTPQVMCDTRTRITRLGLRHAELATLADVDVPADLVHLPATWWAPRSEPAPSAAPGGAEPAH